MRCNFLSVLSLALASGALVKPPHAKLVFVRHGQSTWNKLNLFTGWVDVDLSHLGVEEATAGGVEIKKANLNFDVAFTSMLQRAQKTCSIVLEQSAQSPPVVKDYRLNERHYGALQGKDKKETVMQFGEEQVKEWRRSYDIPPPPCEPGSEHDPTADPLYASIDPACLPSCECLKDTVARCLPLWDESIAPALAAGQTVLVAAHGNSIRGLVKYLDGISDDEITSVEIPTGIPLVYNLDADLKTIPAENSIWPLTGAFLGDASAIAAAQEKVAQQTAVAPPSVTLDEALDEESELGLLEKVDVPVVDALAFKQALSPKIEE